MKKPFRLWEDEKLMDRLKEEDRRMGMNVLRNLRKSISEEKKKRSKK